MDREELREELDYIIPCAKSQTAIEIERHAKNVIEKLEDKIVKSIRFAMEGIKIQEQLAERIKELEEEISNWERIHKLKKAIKQETD